MLAHKGTPYQRPVAMRIVCTLLCIVLLGSCTPTELPPQTAVTDAPSWAQEVVWYQIFVERFRNGDPTNDPTASDIEGTYPGFVPDGWQTTPWSQDWYQPDAYFSELEGRTDDSGNPLTSFNQRSQLRRYGGDLQGVIDKLDYIDSLGVTAIYFNPLNDAPSLHKYDARHWRHMDRNFGPTPEEDVAMMATETPDDPSTWKMTGADQMFVDLVAAFHERGIRVILDYSWNHTGSTSWALQDVITHGADSKYADWYWVESFDDPATPEDEFSYLGWFGIPGLPEIRETVYHDPAAGVKAYEGNIYSKAAKQHIFNVTRRWLDPNGDGDPSDGVDGFRLDVAGEIGMEFWREYRTMVRDVNPEAYLIGEIWWEEFPDKLLDPAPYLEGDVFDAVMNYRWYRAARHFFAEAPDPIPVSEFVDSLQSFTNGIRPGNTYAMMNLVSSHDVPRVLTSIFNDNKYKFEANPGQNPNYKIHRPDEETFQTLNLLLAQQFTYIGAPHIWAGDEMGMWGADDPSCRKPLTWPDLSFDDEQTHPAGLERPIDEVVFNQDVFDSYQTLARLRNQISVLRSGDLEYVVVDDERKLLGYSRFDEASEAIALFNASTDEHVIQVPVKQSTGYQEMLSSHTVTALNGAVEVTLPGRSAAILVSQ